MTRTGRDLAAEVVAALARSARGPLKAKELSRALDVPTHEYRAFRRLLSGMEKAGRVERVRGHRYRLAGPRDLVTGRVSITRRGDGFVRAGGGAPDVFVPSGSLSTAMDGDRVSVRIERRPRGRSPEGAVVEIVERAHKTVVGTLHRGRRGSCVVPLDHRIPRDVGVAGTDRSAAEDGDVVVVRLTAHGDRRKAPAGVSERVLGPASDPGVDVLAVAHGFGLRLDFPPEVLTAAAAVEGRTDDRDPGRVDRTDLRCFTIDPADARDHDDALSVVRLDGDLVEVGVHIADVSHYVRSGDAVDQEARLRGTSVYLVDRVVPMLPEALSAGVCSLRAGEDRLSLSLFLRLDRDARVVERRYERTRIRCTHALAYEAAQAVLDGRSSVDPAVDEALRTLDDRARAIRKSRVARGSLDLDVPEARVVLDETGSAVDVLRRERLESHRLIEDYMVLANEVVAGDLEAHELPGLFRVHERPSPERLSDLAESLTPLGLEIRRPEALKPGDLQKLLTAVEGEVKRGLVSTLVLRTLMKARYDVRNLGHFGLASTGYAHFTSPIRRYPDLVVHRAIAAAFLGAPAVPDPVVEQLEGVADWSSEREQAAEAAERATVALKKCELMSHHLGESFTGTVTGVTSFGVFVTLDDFFVDGLVHVSSLGDDFYRLDPRTHALVGERGGRRYGIGDRMEVQVVRVDKEARHIDFLAIRKLPPVD